MKRKRSEESILNAKFAKFLFEVIENIFCSQGRFTQQMIADFLIIYIKKPNNIFVILEESGLHY